MKLAQLPYGKVLQERSSSIYLLMHSPSFSAIAGLPRSRQIARLKFSVVKHVAIPPGRNFLKTYFIARSSLPSIQKILRILAPF